MQLHRACLGLHYAPPPLPTTRPRIRSVRAGSRRSPALGSVGRGEQFPRKSPEKRQYRTRGYLSAADDLHTRRDSRDHAI